MKRIFYVSILIVMLTMLMISPALAKSDKGKGNIKGEVTIINAETGSLTILTNQGETVLVFVPAGFDLAAVQVGDLVLVKGDVQADGSILADTIKVTGKNKPDGDEQEQPDTEKGNKSNSAYCSEGKQTKTHPLAIKLAERFEVSESWVMEYFCQGQSMGAIMLALLTAQIDGSDPATLLASRTEGKGWGQIWQELGLIGSEKEGKSPPGLLKKPNKAEGKP
jgi:hypothetical protein